MKTANEFGPWTMNAADDCRLNSLWKQRFDALQADTAKRPSRRHKLGLLLLLTLIVGMPSWHVGQQTAIAQERPVVESVDTHRVLGESALPAAQPQYDFGGAVRSAPALANPNQVKEVSGVNNQPAETIPAVPEFARPWQLVDSTQLPASSNITLMTGQQLNLDMPRGGTVSTAGTKGVFAARLDATTGDILIHGHHSGVGTLSFSHSERKQVDFQVVVVTDPTPLKALYEKARLGHITITPGVQSVILSGNVATTDELKRCNAMASDFYPHVVNNIRIRNQQVMLSCRIFEFTTTEAKLPAAVEQLFQGADKTSHAKGIYSSLLEGDAFDTKLDELRKLVDVRLIAEPTLVTVSGRPAAFNAGGEFPILVPQAADTVAVEYKQFGTRVDFIPRVMKDGRIHLEMRPQITQLMGDKEHAVQVNGHTIPALKQRWVDVACEMSNGQTMVAALIHKNKQGKTIGLVSMVRPSLLPDTGTPGNPDFALTSPNQSEAKAKAAFAQPLR